MTHNYLGLKILEFTGELGPYCSKLFADLGADIIHLEPLSGDPIRRIGPFYKNIRDQETSLQHLYYNAGKRSMPIDLQQESGKELFRKLCAQSDLLIESFVPGYLDNLGLSYADLRKINPRLVQTAVTPFGQFGPMAFVPGSDLTCSAIGGFLYLAGVGNDKPVRAPDNQSYRMAEAYAAVGSAIALFHAKRTGEGQFIDVACVESVGMALENAAQYWDLEKKIRRGRGREAGTATVHPCRDGYIVIVAIMGKNKGMWVPFLNWMKSENVEEAEKFEGDQWIEPAYRSSEEGYELFCRIFERYSKQHSKQYLYEIGQHYKVSVSPVSNGKDLLENQQLEYRKYWQEIDNPNLGGIITYPGAPYEISNMKWGIQGNAPLFGEHTREILLNLGYTNEAVTKMHDGGVVYAR